MDIKLEVQECFKSFSIEINHNYILDLEIYF